MQKKRFIIFLISICLILLVVSCKKDKAKSTSKIFPVEKHLKASILPFDFIIERQSCTIVDDCLIVISAKTDTLIYVFSLPELNLIQSFGKKGKGPDELSSPSFVKNTSELLCISDSRNPNLIQCFRIEKKSNTLMLHKEYNLKDISIWDTRNLHIINDSVLFYFEYHLPGIRLGAYHLKLEKNISIKEIEVNENHDRSFEYLNTGFLKANSQTVAYAYLYQDKIEFMHHDFSFISVRKNENSTVYIDENWLSNNSVIYYTAGYAGKEKMYFLNSGCSINELKEGKKSRSIEVFDNKGTPLIKYYLDFALCEFAVDEKNNKLYGWSDDDDVILVYDLNE